VSKTAAINKMMKEHAAGREPVCYRYLESEHGVISVPVYEDEGFEFEGVFIIDPAMDETMRFSVDPEEYYGQAYLDWKQS